MTLIAGDSPSADAWTKGGSTEKNPIILSIMTIIVLSSYRLKTTENGLELTAKMLQRKM